MVVVMVMMMMVVVVVVVEFLRFLLNNSMTNTDHNHLRFCRKPSE